MCCGSELRFGLCYCKNLCGDLICLPHGEFGNVVEVGASARQGASDVKVKVRNGLVCRRAVVLPDRDSRRSNAASIAAAAHASVSIIA